MNPPYTVVEHPYGVTGRMFPSKVYPNGQPGPILTEDEIAMWKYVEHLRMELLSERFDNCVPAPEGEEEPELEPEPVAAPEMPTPKPAGKKKKG